MAHRIVFGVMMACAAWAAQAQDTTPPQNAQVQRQEIAKGDPARWHHEDTSVAGQTKILRKEIAAALAEAKVACRKGPASERSACLKDAQDTYQHDMSRLPQIVASNDKQ